MIAESGPARIIEIDRAGQLLHAVKLKVDHPHPHTDTRLARKLTNGHYLVCHEGDGAVREYDPAGNVVWEYPVPLFGKQPKPGHGPEAFGNKCFSAVRLPSGNTLDCHRKRPRRARSHAAKEDRLANPTGRSAGHRAGLGDNARSAAQRSLRDRQLPRRPRAAAVDRARSENQTGRVDVRPVRPPSAIPSPTPRSSTPATACSAKRRKASSLSGQDEKRRRWESNPRWRICNQKSRPDNVERNDDSQQTAAQIIAQPQPQVDPQLARVVAAWGSLPEPIKRAMLALIG